MWNGLYQDLYNKAKRLITKNACMKFYDASKPLHLQTDASGIDLGASLMQMWEGMNCRCEEVPNNVALHSVVFASKSLSSVK